MKHTVLLFVCSFLLLSFRPVDTGVPTEGETIVIQINNFDSDKNMAVYSLFRNDPHLEIISSCDALGLIVLETKEYEIMSRNEASAYSYVKLNGLLESGTYEVRTDMHKAQIMLDCRAEMQRLINPSGE